MHKHHMRKRLAGLIAVLMLAAGITAASALAAARSAHGHDEKQPARVELTYTKWFAPGFPNMVGDVGGDISGSFGGAVLRATADSTSRFVQLRAVYIVVARDPAESFTAHVEGVQDNETHTAVLDGRVVDGYLKRAHVHAQYTVIKCTQASNGTCFQGTISVTQRAETTRVRTWRGRYRAAVRLSHSDVAIGWRGLCP